MICFRPRNRPSFNYKGFPTQRFQACSRNYNAFLAREAEQKGYPSDYAATVERRRGGSFGICFPPIRTGRRAAALEIRFNSSAAWSFDGQVALRFNWLDSIAGNLSLPSTSRNALSFVDVVGFSRHLPANQHETVDGVTPSRAASLFCGS